MSTHACVVERAPVWWRQHWLENCEAFRVECAGRVLGYVEEIERTEADEATSLVIECRGAEPMRVRIASTDVLDVDPHRCLVTLRARANFLPVRRRAMAG
jgi:hypothetical protein